jgi:hypothetical protein
MSYTAYYVPNFPVDKVTDDGRDGWINMPHHPKSQYRFLDAILEHIDNTNHIDPVRIIIHDPTQVQVGPAGTSRFHALRHLRNYAHLPAIVSTTQYFDWFGEGVVKIENEDQLRSYFLLEPVAYGIEPDGKAHWHNQNPNEKQMRETFNVSKETIQRLLNCIEV